jgi:flagellar hook-basal body complex protein FliE
MGIKDELHKTIDNVSDTINQAGHETNAAAERATREAAGDTMTTGEKAKSILNEGKEKVLAEVDRTKRDVRNNV